MGVRPEDEDRQDEQDAVSCSAPRVKDEQGDHGDEQRIRQRLGARRRVWHENRDPGEPDERDAVGACAEDAGDAEREGVRTHDDCGVHEQEPLDPGDRVNTVEEELSRPLLVDPSLSVRPDRQGVVLWEAPVDQLPTRGEKEPGLSAERRRQSREQERSARRDHQRDEAVPFRDLQQARAARPNFAGTPGRPACARPRTCLRAWGWTPDAGRHGAIEA